MPYPLPLLLLAVLLLSFSCDKSTGCNQRSYKLQANLTLTPLQESYRTGDTISMYLEFPEAIVDRNRNDTLQLTHLDIRHGWWMTDQQDIASSRTDVTEHITVLPYGMTVGDFIIEQFGLSTNVLGNLEKLDDNSYAINYKFTLDSVGYFRFDLNNFIQNQAPAEDPISVAGECKDARFYIYYKLDGYQEDNLLLFCEAFPESPNCNRGLTDTEFLDLYDEDFRAGGSYIFKVE